MNAPSQYDVLMRNVNETYIKFTNIHAIINSNSIGTDDAATLRIALTDRWIAYLHAVRDLHNKVKDSIDYD